MATTYGEAWTDFQPYFLSTRGINNVPDRYLANAVWVPAGHRRSEGGYYATSQYPGSSGEEQQYPVEFNFERLTWVEVRWSKGENAWHAFRIAAHDLHLDIPLPPLPSVTNLEEYREPEPIGGQTPEQVQPDTSDDESSKPEDIVIQDDNTTEQLAQLAEYQLSIEPMATSTITQSIQAQVRRIGQHQYEAASSNAPPQQFFAAAPPAPGGGGPGDEEPDQGEPIGPPIGPPGGGGPPEEDNQQTQEHRDTHLALRTSS